MPRKRTGRLPGGSRPNLLGSRSRPARRAATAKRTGGEDRGLVRRKALAKQGFKPPRGRTGAQETAPSS
jgi:hypothetical protein